MDCVSGTCTSAVAGAPGSGCKRKVRRVITPSVPSDPMNRNRKSRPALFLTRRVNDVTTDPSGMTASSPSTESRMVP
ncbi:hypothetical protein D3C87_1982840 [compost metagenome]